MEDTAMKEADGAVEVADSMEERENKGGTKELAAAAANDGETITGKWQNRLSVARWC